MQEGRKEIIHMFFRDRIRLVCFGHTKRDWGLVLQIISSNDKDSKHEKVA